MEYGYRDEEFIHMRDGNKWLWLDWFIFCLRLTWYVTGLVYFYLFSDNLGAISYPFFVFALSMSFLIPHIFWRPGYSNLTMYPIVEFLVTCSFSIYASVIMRVDLGNSLLLIPFLMIGYLCTRKTAKWAIPLYIIVLPSTRILAIEDTYSFIMQFIDYGLFLSIGLGFNLIIHSHLKTKRVLVENQEQYKKIQEQHALLEQYSKKIKNLTLLEERNRLARDLHDSIGHHFTSMTMALDALSIMIEKDPKLAQEKVKKLASLARTGLDEIRKSIHQIAPDDVQYPFARLIRDTAEDFEMHTNATVELDIKGSEYFIPPQVSLSLLRCVQESLTNGIKHGNASMFSLELLYLPTSLTVTIENNGTQLNNTAPGFGMKTMNERMVELNGEYTIGNLHGDRGVKITLSVPIGGRHEQRYIANASG